MSFFFCPTIKLIIIAFPFDICLIFFLLYYFFYSKFCLICSVQFFFIKRSNNFFTVKITNNTSPWHIFFNFCNQKDFFMPIWSITFCKNIFVFRYSNMLTNLGFSLVFFLSKSIYVLDFTSTGFILIVL